MSDSPRPPPAGDVVCFQTPTLIIIIDQHEIKPVEVVQDVDEKRVHVLGRRVHLEGDGAILVAAVVHGEDRIGGVARDAGDVVALRALVFWQDEGRWTLGADVVADWSETRKRKVS